jgi:hypothetical protein
VLVEQKEPQVSRNWFYTHHGQTHGPVSTDEVKRLAANHLLLPDDLLWPEGVDPEQAVSAGAALDYTKPLPPTTPAPDWLDDVHKAELSGLKLLSPSCIPMPDWLDDIRIAEGQPQDKQEPPPLPLPKEPVVPDWLNGFLPEEPKAPVPVPPPEEVLSIDIAPFAIPTEPIPSASSGPEPVPIDQSPLAIPTEPIPPAAPMPPAPLPKAAPDTQVPLALPAQALATAVTQLYVSPPPEASVAMPPSPAALPDEAGLDPMTGQVLDEAMFKDWEKRQRQQRQRELESQVGLSYGEIYRKAQRELESWIDADENQELVVRGSLDVIQGHPKVLEILQHYRTHGKEMVNKLTRHLTFVVDNRRKYYEAMKKR